MANRKAYYTRYNHSPRGLARRRRYEGSPKALRRQVLYWRRKAEAKDQAKIKELEEILGEEI